MRPGRPIRVQEYLAIRPPPASVESPPSSTKPRPNGTSSSARIIAVGFSESMTVRYQVSGADGFPDTGGRVEEFSADAFVASLEKWGQPVSEVFEDIAIGNGFECVR